MEWVQASMEEPSPSHVDLAQRLSAQLPLLKWPLINLSKGWRLQSAIHHKDEMPRSSRHLVFLGCLASV